MLKLYENIFKLLN